MDQEDFEHLTTFVQEYGGFVPLHTKWSIEFTFDCSVIFSDFLFATQVAAFYQCTLLAVFCRGCRRTSPKTGPMAIICILTLLALYTQALLYMMDLNNCPWGLSEATQTSILGRLSVLFKMFIDSLVLLTCLLAIFGFQTMKENVSGQEFKLLIFLVGS